MTEFRARHAEVFACDGADSASTRGCDGPRSRRFTTGLLLLAVCAGGAACADGDGGAEAPGPPAADITTEPQSTTESGPAATAAALGIENVAEPIPGLVTSAQPTAEQVQALRENGFDRFVSLRPATESGAGWEEERLPDEAFDRVGVDGAAGLTRERVEALDRILTEAGDERTLLYCSSSNRVGALLALRAHWLQGADMESALELGREAGLASLEEAVRELISGGASLPA